MHQGFLGNIPQGVGKNGEGDTFCFSFGDTLGTGIMQKFGWLRGYLWKSSKIPALCGIPRVSHYLMMVTVKQSDSSNSRAGTTYKDIRTCPNHVLGFNKGTVTFMGAFFSFTLVSSY